MHLSPNVAFVLSFVVLFITPSTLGHVPHQVRRHNILRRYGDLARRGPGEISSNFYKRDGGLPFTYYAPGLGSCGGYNVASDFIVALNSAQYDSEGGSNVCFTEITITIGDKSTTAQIVDRCPGCPWGGLDLSPGLFAYFADLGAGVLYGSWESATAPTPTSTPLTPSTTAYIDPQTTTTSTSEYLPSPTSTASTNTLAPWSTTTSSSPSATPSSSTSSSAPPQQTTTISVTAGDVPGGNSSVLYDLNLALVFIGDFLVNDVGVSQRRVS